MTIAEMHTAVKVLVDKIDSLNYPDIQPEELDLFLNKEIERFIKHRVDGTLARNRGFEETQKRMDDLRNITKTSTIIPDPVSADNKPNGRFITLPNSANDIYWFAINEEANVRVKECNGSVVPSGSIEDGVIYIVQDDSITYQDIVIPAGSFFTGVTRDVGGSPFVVNTYTGEGKVYNTEVIRSEIKPLQHDDYNKVIKDPFNKPVISSAFSQIRRLQLAGQVELLLPDTDAQLEEYILRYIRKPAKVSLALSVDCELADHTHQEIVDMAVSSILETIESGRYQSHLNELNKLE